MVQVGEQVSTNLVGRLSPGSSSPHVKVSLDETLNPKLPLMHLEALDKSGVNV